MRTFYEPKGNHGYGVATGATEGAQHVVISIRTKDGQGEILTFNNVEDLRDFVMILHNASQAAFGEI